MANADDVGSELRAAVGNESNIVLDLGPLDYLDSAGMRMLFDLSEWLAREGRQLVLAVALDSPVRKVLSITKLDTLVPVHEDVREALSESESPRPDRGE
jgi:anti-anti-sigma factor